MNIIGINGFKRSGKGEVGKILAELLPAPHQLGFADKLKVYAARSLGYLDLTEAECIALMDDAKETWDFGIKRLERHDLGISDPSRLNPGWACWEPVKQLSGRAFLQNLGTEARKMFGDDFWVNQVLPEMPRRVQEIAPLMEDRYPGVQSLVFTDLRFLNEADRVLDLGGIVVEVVRPGTSTDGHASEQKLPAGCIDSCILNDGTLADLRVKVEDFVERWGLRS